MTNNTVWTTDACWQKIYKEAIEEALLNEEKFKIFRINPNYNVIVPNVPRQEAQILFDKLIEYPDIMNKFSTIKLMDNIGSPELCQPWYTSPRNFKYMYTAARIKENFGDDIKNIIEIGIGYGGLCFTMTQYFNLEGYKLVDLDYVIELTKKFLSKLVNNDNNFYDSEPPYDLGISECAITELDDPSIQYYYDKYLSQCKYLFIRTNFNNIGRLNWFIDIVKQDFKVKMEPDLPNEETQTALLGWHK